MNKYANLENWDKIISVISFDDTQDTIQAKMKEATPEYSFDEFLKDCNNFLINYTTIVGYSGKATLNKKLVDKFHKVAKILQPFINLQGNDPASVKEQEVDTMFKYLTDTNDNDEIILQKAASVNNDSFYTQNNDQSLRDNDGFGDSNVDYLTGEEQTAKVSSLKVFNLKYSSLNEFNDPSYLYSVMDLYNIKNFEDIKFNKDKKICSIYFK